MSGLSPVQADKQWYNYRWTKKWCNYSVLKKTSNAKSELVLLEMTPRLCLPFVLNDMRLINTYIITQYGVMNYSSLMPNLVAFYAKLNEIYSVEFHFALEFLSVYVRQA